MRRRSRAGGERSKAQRRKTAARKSRIAPKAVRPRRSSATDQDTDVARLNRERDEAFRQQAATAEVLKVISRSLFDLPKVLNTLVESAARLCEADKALILRPTAKDSSYHSAASYRHTPAFIEMVGAQTFGPDRGGVTGRVLLEGKSVHIADVLADPEYKHRDLARVGDFRTILGVPLLREGIPIGIFLLQRAVVCPFSEKQIMLVETFADQAVIAIENTRLFEAEQQRRRELAESLEQQTATSEVLRVISSSRGELQQVFAAMLANAARICEAKYGLLWLVEADGFRPVAHHGLRALEKGYPVDRVLRPEPDLPLARLARSKQVVHVLDARTEPAYIRGYPPFVPLIDVGGARTLLLVPMLKADVLVGAIAIYRQEVRSFTDKQVELVQNFATQAVIAIENTRLLTELRESLERQTATADVLGIISSSPGELEPVFNAILQNAIRICGAQNATLWLYENGQVRRAARHSGLLGATVPPRPSARAALMRALQTKQIVYLDDYRNDQAYRDGDPFVVPAVDQLSIRTYVAVPMLKEGEPIGVISIYRTEVRPFSEKQIQLIASFAAQAVIAIENARLLNELRESLQQQTGTADVLQAISRSTFDLPTVLSTLVESAARLCRADMAQILLPSKDVYSFYSAASYGHTPEYNEYLKTLTFAPGREGVVGRVLLEHKPVQIADVLADPDYRLREVQRLGGFRTHLGLPLLREGNPIGILIVSRATVQPFDDKHIALLTTFADQAVIAIENTRLFEAEQQRTRELTESLEQQTATSDVLKAISGSPSDLEPVFETMLERAVRICDAKFGNIYRWDGGALHLAAAHNTPPALAEARRRAPVIPTRNLMIDRMLSTKTAIHVIDAVAQRGDTGAAAAFELGGARTVLAVPMFKENELVGSFALYRQEVRPFTDKQIELVTNFAAQAVIAIENAAPYRTAPAHR
jgi:GAF domain-containing protein